MGNVKKHNIYIYTYHHKLLDLINDWKLSSVIVHALLTIEMADHCQFQQNR
jgi:hypothetical protein